MNKIKYSIYFTSCFLISTGASAQVAPVEVKGPLAILVQLKAERNREEGLARANNTSMLQALRNDRDKVREVMINDFTDHFKYCPVYYFIDTNYDKIKANMLAGVLLDKDGSPLQQLPALKDKYLIITYGKPELPQINGNEYHGISVGKGLIINDAHFKQLAYFYKMEYDEKKLKKRSSPKYYFKSRIFDMEYFPGAELLNKRMASNPVHIPDSKLQLNK
ncbi:MAG: hypothetical protein H7257_02870 [Taibaiella sp.]|nr:hypothetical protein [Taibaiella sp.]